jgi:hypothetical protein
MNKTALPVVGGGSAASAGKEDRKPRPHRSAQSDPPKPHATAPALPGRRPSGSDIRRR